MDTEWKEASSCCVAYGGPISVSTFLNEWNCEPSAYTLSWYTCGAAGVRGGGSRRPRAPAQAGPCQHLIGHQEEALLKGKANHGLDALAGLHLPWGAGGGSTAGSDSGSELRSSQG